MVNAETIARESQKLVDAIMAKLEPLIDKKIGAFVERMQSIADKGLRKSSVHSNRDKIDNGRGKKVFDRGKFVVDLRSKDQGEQLQSRIQKNHEETKRCQQELLEALEAFQKQKRATHQSVPEPKAPSVSITEGRILIVKSSPHDLLDTKITSKKLPNWQSLKSNLTELQQETTRQAELIGGCTRSNTKLNHIQERTLTCSVLFKENPPDINIQSPKQRTQGSRKASWKRTRRTQRWEEDQRYKPPDWDRNQLQNFGFFFQIKEEPPDATYTSKPSSCSLGGKFLIVVEFKSANLLYFHADKSDLRSNPFQVGGDDVIMTSSDVTVDDLEHTRPTHSIGSSSSEDKEPHKDITRPMDSIRSGSSATSTPPKSEACSQLYL